VLEKAGVIKKPVVEKK
jgi:hypothetical protein